MSERDKVLDKILKIPGAAAKLKQGVRTMKTTLDERGLQPREKSLKRKGVMEEAGGKLDEVKAMLSDDPNLAQELLEFMMDLVGAHPEPDADEMAAEPDAANEFEEEYEADDEFTEEEKAQPGYGEMEPNTSAELVNQAITKKPGTFPKPVSHQVETGKGKGKRGKAMPDDDKLIRAVKSLDERLADVEAALAELADLPERFEQLAPITVNKAFRPRQASEAAETVETDPETMEKVKAVDARFDTFFNANVKPK